jgi:phytoene synthase
MLDLYCRRVAGSVGLLALPVFGAAGPAERELALYAGRALQLTNILRDLQADAAAGRLYVPGEYLSAVDIAARDPAAALRHPRFAEAAQRLANDAHRAFAAADRQLALSDRRAVWPAAAMLAAYRSLLGRLERAGFPAGRPIAPSRVQALGAALRAAVAARL